MTLEQIAKAALDLPADQRETLAAQLWQSLDESGDGDLPSNWRELVLRRRDDFESGREEGIAADRVFADIRKELGWM